MNSYKLGFGLVVAISLFMAYFISKPSEPDAPFLAESSQSPPETRHIFSALPNDWTPKTDSTLPSSPPPPPNKQAVLEPLLTAISSIMQELSILQKQLFNPLTPYQPIDVTIEQTYQPRIDELSQQLNQKIMEASDISKPITQRFIWEEALSLGLEDSISSLAINLFNNAIDDALFEDMLITLSSGGQSTEARSSLIFNILLTSETYYDSGTPDKKAGESPANPRLQRIQQFIETQFQQEADPEILKAYLDIYHIMSQNQQWLVSAERFSQQLDMLRTRIAPDQYFSFRLQNANLTDPSMDMASLLRDISSTPMTAEQRKNLQSQLGNTVFMYISPNTPTVSNQALPEPLRQLMISYLESGLTLPTLQDRYSLYEYGNQTYAIELLKNPEQAANTFYQRIVNSQVPEEQIALVLTASVGGDELIKRLQQNTVLHQHIEEQLQQTQQPDKQNTLQEAVNILKGAPPMAADAPLEAYGSTTYYIDDANTTRQYEPTLDNGLPAAQYPSY